VVLAVPLPQLVLAVLPLRQHLLLRRRRRKRRRRSRTRTWASVYLTKYFAECFEKEKP